MYFYPYEMKVIDMDRFRNDITNSELSTSPASDVNVIVNKYYRVLISCHTYPQSAGDRLPLPYFEHFQQSAVTSPKMLKIRQIYISDHVLPLRPSKYKGVREAQHGLWERLGGE